MARLDAGELAPSDFIIRGAVEMLHELHEDKGNAAIFALTKLADEDVIDQLKFQLLEVILLNLRKIL